MRHNVQYMSQLLQSQCATQELFVEVIILLIVFTRDGVDLMLNNVDIPDKVLEILTLSSPDSL